MNDEKHKIVQELLKDVFNNINNWLAFAEAKNAALIVFNIACISFIVDTEWFTQGNSWIYISCIGMLLSTVIALASFFGRTGKEAKDGRNCSDSDNLILYKDAAKYCKTGYLEAVFKQYARLDSVSEEEMFKIELDYADEITYNAKITIIKYKFFNVALGVEIITLLMLVVMIICM